MSTAPQYRAAVLGHTGRGNYGHSLDMAFTGFPNVDIVALADPDPEGRAAAAARCGATRTYADPYELLEQERPNLVAVATSWLDVHQDLWLAAIEVGAHIYSEKPIAKSLEEADRMLAAADAKGVKIAIAHQNRVSPYHVYARKLLHEGAIGQLPADTGLWEDGRAGWRAGHDGPRYPHLRPDALYDRCRPRVVSSPPHPGRARCCRRRCPGGRG